MVAPRGLEPRTSHSSIMSVTNYMRKSRKKRSIVWGVMFEDLQKILNESSSFKEVLKKINMPTTGGNYKTLHLRLNLEKFDFSEFKKNKSAAIKEQLSCMNRTPDKEAFVEGSTMSRGGIKKRLLEKGVDYKCEICEISAYNGLPISLQLDHINGINNDNRVENLRFLCPNCHSQTDNFAGRSNKIINNCECGKKIYKNSEMCLQCSGKKQSEKRGVIWPTPEILQKLLWEKSTVKIAKELGVSDKAVEKYAKKHNLTKPQRGYWQKQVGVVGFEPTLDFTH